MVIGLDAGSDKKEEGKGKGGGAGVRCRFWSCISDMINEAGAVSLRYPEGSTKLRDEGKI